MLTRGGYRLIEKDEAYLTGEFCKEILLEAGEDGVPWMGRGHIRSRKRRKKRLVATQSALVDS
jgi:hypothetical protein